MIEAAYKILSTNTIDLKNLPGKSGAIKVDFDEVDRLSNEIGVTIDHVEQVASAIAPIIKKIINDPHDIFAFFIEVLGEVVEVTATITFYIFDVYMMDYINGLEYNDFA
jgi:hypothetical protein